MKGHRLTKNNSKIRSNPSWVTSLCFYERNHSRRIGFFYTTRLTLTKLCVFSSSTNCKGEKTPLSWDYERGLFAIFVVDVTQGTFVRCEDYRCFYLLPREQLPSCANLCLMKFDSGSANVPMNHRPRCSSVGSRICDVSCYRVKTRDRCIPVPVWRLSPFNLAILSAGDADCPLWEPVGLLKSDRVGQSVTVIRVSPTLTAVLYW